MSLVRSPPQDPVSSSPDNHSDKGGGFSSAIARPANVIPSIRLKAVRKISVQDADSCRLRRGRRCMLFKEFMRNSDQGFLANNLPASDSTIPKVVLPESFSSSNGTPPRSRIRRRIFRFRRGGLCRSVLCSGRLTGLHIRYCFVYSCCQRHYIRRPFSSFIG
jgi:hypothetical protein